MEALIVGGIIAVSIIVRAIFQRNVSRDESRPAPVSTMPVGAIGWTQDSISPRVYNVTLQRQVEIQDVVDQALNDRRGALAFMRERFPEPMCVFDSGENGTLSIDNRRLAIYRLVVPGDTQIPVMRVTRQRAGELLDPDSAGDPQAAEAALLRRYTTQTGGYSIRIRGRQGVTLSGDCFARSPFVE